MCRAYSLFLLSLTAHSLTQWSPLLLSLREKVQEACGDGSSFNSLLCNLYRDGKDSIGWHSDDEASLGPAPTIASLSLGDTRLFSLRKQPPPVRGGPLWAVSVLLHLRLYCSRIE